MKTIASAVAIIAILMLGSDPSPGQDQITPGGVQTIPVHEGGDEGSVVSSRAVIQVLMPGSDPSTGEDQCSSNSEHSIQIREGSDGRPELAYRRGSAKNVQVCLGDKVQWLLNGAIRTYFVDFGEGPPVLGPARHASKDNALKLTIGGAAQPGHSYEYSVEFDQVLAPDPRIVVD
jgi:hypothetical protein